MGTREPFAHLFQSSKASVVLNVRRFIAMTEAFSIYFLQLFQNKKAPAIAVYFSLTGAF